MVCVDGLEPRHVDTFRLTSLAQEHRGTHRVDTRYNSVQLWRAFLTGRPPSSFNNAFVEARGPRLPWLRRRVPYRLRRALYMARARPPATPVGDTFIALAVKPLVVNMFAYNEEPEQFKLRLRYSLPRIVGDAEASLEAYRRWEEWTQRIMQRFLTALERGGWDLAVTHIYITDIAGHLAAKPSLSWMVPRAYRLANMFVGKVKRLVGSAAVLVVSDHGMRHGIHAPRGFWSLNVEPPFTPRTITDFRRLVEAILHEY